MLKEFLVKRQLKKLGVAGPSLDAMMKVVKNNPGLFQRLGQEIENKVSQNKLTYDAAALAVIAKYRPELTKIFKQK